MKTNFIIASAISAFVAGTAAAQTTTFDNAGAAADAVSDLEEQILDDQERDLIVFGNEGRETGTYGSIALRYTSTSNDGDTSNDLGVGLRWGYYDGVNGFDANANYVYGDDNGVQTENRLLMGLDYRRDLNSALFAYGQLDLSFDRLTTTAGEYTQDAFIGAGLGYRVIDNANTQWTVQAGPGYRVAEVVGGGEVAEFAASASSNLFYSLTDTVFLTNDTDVIYSETATTVANDLAVNVALTDTLALRTSYATRFNSATDNKFTDGENTLGVSVVYTFQ